MEEKQEKDPMAWEVLDSEYLYRKPWLTARRDHVKLPTGAEIQDFYVLEYPEFCNVIALTKEGKFLMERQYRHAQRLTAYEIPAGCVEPGEDPMEAAKRELYEETGYAGGEWSHFMTVSPNPGACTNHSYTYLAIGVERVSTQHLEESEDIRIVLMEREEVIRLLQQDEFHQAMMAAPLWKYFATKDKI
jgi:8-oxo-dGTP pyrophosphatase MutT (NUDIX family)